MKVRYFCVEQKEPISNFRMAIITNTLILVMIPLGVTHIKKYLTRLSVGL